MADPASTTVATDFFTRNALFFQSLLTGLVGISAALLTNLGIASRERTAFKQQTEREDKKEELLAKTQETQDVRALYFQALNTIGKYLYASPKIEGDTKVRDPEAAQNVYLSGSMLLTRVESYTLRQRLDWFLQYPDHASANDLRNQILYLYEQESGQIRKNILSPDEKSGQMFVQYAYSEEYRIEELRKGKNLAKPIFWIKWGEISQKQRDLLLPTWGNFVPNGGFSLSMPKKQDGRIYHGGDGPWVGDIDIELATPQEIMAKWESDFTKRLEELKNE
jgi:hypothetical protein